MTSIEQRTQPPRALGLGEPFANVPSVLPSADATIMTTRYRSRAGWRVRLCAILPIGALTAGLGIALHQNARDQAAHERVVALVADARADQEFFTQRRLAASAATGVDLRARTLADAQAAAEHARAVAVQAEHAGAQNLAALQAAAQLLEETVARLGTDVSPAEIRATQAAADAAAQTAQTAETAWQEEQTRLAAEQAARETARQAAAAAAARQPTRAGSATTTATTTNSADARGAPGVQSAGISGLGAALNQQRAEAGLNQLTVIGSSSLTDHAAEMAEAGRIWHSGHDNIVGWVDPASDVYMIQAYMDSPPHRAWILKEGLTQVAIGAVAINGVLYTAMVFS